MERFYKTNYKYVYNDKQNNTYIETNITYKNTFGEYPKYVKYTFK